MEDEVVIEQTQTETPQESTEHVEQSQPQPQQRMSDKEANFAAMREKIAQMEAEKEYYRRLATERDQRQAIDPEESYDINVGESDLVEGKHIKTIDKKVAKEIQKMRKELAEYKAATQSATAEIQLRSKYHDFDAVVNADNIKQLSLVYPEIARTIELSSSDLRSKGETAYNLIKAMGIYKADPYAESKQRAAANAQKPISASAAAKSGGDSALANAGTFGRSTMTEERREALLKSMNEALKYR